MVVRTDEGFYAAAEASAHERKRATKKATRSLDALNLTLTGECREPTATLDAAAESVRERLHEEGWQTADATRANTGDVAEREGQRCLQILRGEHSASLFVAISHDADWVYPDSPSLWTTLRHAADLRAHPVLIARRIAPVTFPLLAAFNARGLQYYNMLGSGDVSGAGPECEGLGLPRMTAARHLADHASYSQLMRLIEERSRDSWQPEVMPAFEDALGRGFGTRRVTSAEFAAWAGSHRALPKRWREAMQSVTRASDGRETGKPSRDIAHRRPAVTAPLFGRETQVTRVPIKAW
jgi:hypothetical protein